MTQEELEALVGNIRTTVGEETGAVISEHLANIVSGFSSVNQTLTDTVAENNKIKKEKDELISVNGKLFQKVGSTENITISKNIDNPKNEDDEDDIITEKDIFDDKGDFIK